MFGVVAGRFGDDGSSSVEHEHHIQIFDNDKFYNTIIGLPFVVNNGAGSEASGVGNGKH